MHFATFNFSEYCMDINKIWYMLFNQIFTTRNIVFILKFTIKNVKSIQVLDDIAGHIYRTQFIGHAINTV
jgi:hypothetical protein